jgi:glutamate-1-semialdehyde 2,1-aminomutase
MPELRPSRPSARGRELQCRAHGVIPGGSHTYAKGDDQFPEAAPPLIARGLGCHAWDIDGNEFIEYSMGLRAVTLGHAFEPVIRSVRNVLELGTNFTRPSPLELECAEKLLAMVPTAEQVKFTKDGSTAVTAAIKLARAHTGRPMVAYCADHPFFSYDDWFVSSFQMSAGIPDEHRRLSATFRYNDLDSLERVFVEHEGRVACVILEGERSEEPRDDFLRRAQELSRKNGALFVLDEMITGFRWHNGGAQAVYGLDPDLSAFGKGLANGFACSALVGRREVMELGGWEHGRDRVFLLSTTHGAESVGLAAAIATIDFYQQHEVIGRLHAAGKRLREGCNDAARDLGISDHFQVEGRDSNLIFTTRDQEGVRSQPFRTLFMQELVRRGVLGPSFVVSYSHSDQDIDLTIDATREALEVYRRGLESGVDTVLEGRPVQPVDRRRG